MLPKIPLNIFWFRRDLRMEDNAGLFHALNSEFPTLPVFIFDPKILKHLEQKDDRRVTFIHQTLTSLNEKLAAEGSSLVVKFETPAEAFKQLADEFNIRNVYANADYEPYARERDATVGSLLKEKEIGFQTFKDHVIFEKAEILKEDGSPYTVFSPYKRKWLDVLNPDQHLKHFPSERHLQNLAKLKYGPIPDLSQLGFRKNPAEFPDTGFSGILKEYAQNRDIPALEGTSKTGVHLRFGTLGIRHAARVAIEQVADAWLSELIWRDFYAMILWHFPYSAYSSFKKEYEKIRWRNNEEEFNAWCQGNTGYAMVDAGMRQLNSTGWMHNRLRMITASFLCKHLLIDWRWGEAYFAQRLIDYDQASNVGGWQWAAGTGNDAVPYFRIFNPELQMKKFDKNLEYVRKWVPEFDQPLTYPPPIVEHRFARERAIRVYKEALTK